jgi:hypothetical protein
MQGFVEVGLAEHHQHALGDMVEPELDGGGVGDLLVRDGEAEPRLGARREPAHQAGAQHVERLARDAVHDLAVLLGAPVALVGAAEEVDASGIW